MSSCTWWITSGRARRTRTTSRRAARTSPGALRAIPARLWTVGELVRHPARDRGGRSGARSHREYRSGPLARRAARWTQAPRHIENVKTLIQTYGRGRHPGARLQLQHRRRRGPGVGPWGRGGGSHVGMDGPVDTPMPLGVAWNMVVDQTAPPGTVPSVDAGRTLAPAAAVSRRGRAGG